jgi:hypothetical protein
MSQRHLHAEENIAKIGPRDWLESRQISENLMVMSSFENIDARLYEIS